MGVWIPVVFDEGDDVSPVGEDDELLLGPHQQVIDLGGLGCGDFANGEAVELPR